MASLRGVSPPFEFTNILFVTLIFLSLFSLLHPQMRSFIFSTRMTGYANRGFITADDGDSPSIRLHVCVYVCLGFWDGFSGFQADASATSTPGYPGVFHRTDKHICTYIYVPPYNYEYFYFFLRCTYLS